MSLAERLLSEHNFVERALRLTIANESERPLCYIESLGDSCRGAAHCLNGFRLERDDDGYTLLTTTIDNGRIVVNCRAHLDANGVAVGPVLVNCFGLGFSTYDDAEYVEEYLQETWNDFQRSPKSYWDRFA